jgi:hypothetical protein
MEMPSVLPRSTSVANTLQFSSFTVYLILHGWNTKESGNQHGFIASKISAIRWHHHMLTGYDPETDAGFPLMKKHSKPMEKRYPLAVKMPRNILSGWISANQDIS